jgi:hypothetical protein
VLKNVSSVLDTCIFEVYILSKFCLTGLHIERKNNLDTEKVKNCDYDFESMVKLLRAFRDDTVIKKKVINILKMDSYSRRFVINNWLEQLRRNKAPQALLTALSYLFDDNVAEEILILIRNRKI